jgi:conjugative relaxase-like TrwC/TraI family protein
MMSVSAMQKGSGAYYSNLAREDYYTEGGEPPGQWLGDGADELGLTGKIDKKAFSKLLQGYDANGKKLVQNAGENHQQGWDLTFSAPKSVSVVWSQADLPDRAAIQKAQAAAVKAAIDYLQAESAWTRRGKGGQEKEIGRLVVASFEHSTSRELDPQLHTHALVMNVCKRADGTTGTLESIELFKHQRAGGAIYRAELARQLMMLGYQVEKKEAWFEIRGVPSELHAEFSKRRQQILAKLQEKGQDGAKASEIAALDTRTTKTEINRAVLFDKWRDIGREANYVPPQHQFDDAVLPFKRQPESVIKQTLEQVVADNSHFAKREMVQRLAENAVEQGWASKELLAKAKDLLRTDEVIGLGVHKREQRYTTWEQLALERTLLALAEKVHAPKRALANDFFDPMKSVIKRYPTIKVEQAKAVEHITDPAKGISVVQGMPGTGKSYMLKVAREVWVDQGHEVIGVAVSAKAAKGLEESSAIKSRTLASFLIKNGEGVERGSVIVVDEAGMVSTRDMLALMRISEAKAAKVVLVGDTKQLQAIGPGGAMRYLGAKYGQAKLQEITRQKDERDRQNVKRFAAGDADKAVADLVKRGLMTVTPNRDQAIDKLVEDWGQRYGEKFVLAGTRLEAHRLNKALQQKAHEMGETSGEMRHGLRVGDPVMFSKADKALAVINGTAGRISHLGLHHVIVELDGGGQRRVDLREYKNLNLGYAGTTHKAQGATVDYAYVLAGGSMTDKELTLVQASRARHETRFYIDEDAAGEDMADIVEKMNHSRIKTLAVELLPTEPVCQPSPTISHSMAYQR